MNNHLADFIWAVDGVLILFVMILSCHMIAETFLKKRDQFYREIGLGEIQVRFKQIFKPDAKKDSFDLSILVSEIKPTEWLEITRSPGEYIPREFEEGVKRLLKISETAHFAERLAQKGGQKWKTIDALLFIGFAETENAFPILYKYLRHRGEDYRYYAMLALSRLGTQEAITALFESLETSGFSGQKVVSLIDRMPGLKTGQILPFVTNDKEKIKYWAVKLLARLGPSGDSSDIISACQHDSPDVRAAACECLGAWEAKEAVRVIQMCLKDEFWFVRMRAVRALSRIMKADALPVMIETMCSDVSEYVKESAKSAVIADIEKAFPHLITCLRGQEEPTKRQCVDALIETRQIVPILSAVAEDKHGYQEVEKELFRELVLSKIYFGLKRSLEQFPENAKQKIIEKVRMLDPELAAQVAGEAVHA